MIIRLNKDVVAFPDGRISSNDPDGLLAVGGKLTPEWLLTAIAKAYSPGLTMMRPKRYGGAPLKER